MTAMKLHLGLTRRNPAHPDGGASVAEGQVSFCRGGTPGAVLAQR